MAILPISQNTIPNRLKAVEVGVKRYIDLFKFMAQNQEQLKKSSCLDEVAREVTDLKQGIHNSQQEEFRLRVLKTEADLKRAQVLEYALQNPLFCQVNALTINKEGKPIITVLKAAFRLSSPQLLSLLQSLTQADCIISFEGKEYHRLRSSDAVRLFLECAQKRSEQLDPKDLDPDQPITIKLRNNKQVQYTRADYYLLLRTRAPQVREIDWPYADEKILNFLFQANAEYGWNDNRWIQSQSHDLLLRMREFLDHVLGSAARKLYIYTHTDFLFSGKILVVSASRLELKKDQFVQEMQVLLKACPNAEQILIRQTNSEFHFTFTHEEFVQLLANPPEDLSVFFKPRPVRCKNDELMIVDADFYHVMMKYLSECSMLDRFRKIEEIDLHDFDRQTLEYAHIWFKTGEFPRMSYPQMVSLIELLQLLRSDPKWLELAHEHLNNTLPYFTQDDLRNMNWEGIKGILDTYDTSKMRFVQLGPEMYRIEDLLKLSGKVGCPQDLTKLTRPIYLKLESGTVVEGSYTWLNQLERLPDLIDQAHPISISTEPVLAEVILICSDLNSYPFAMLNRLHRFIFAYSNGMSRLLPNIQSALQTCEKISLGDTSKPPQEYWKEVGEGIKKFPRAQLIELAGCPIFWHRGEVEAFVAHGNLELQDLNATVDVHLAVSETQGVQSLVRKIYKAQWKCFSALDPTQAKLTEDPRFLIPDWAFQIYYDCVLKDREFVINNHADARKHSIYSAEVTPYMFQRAHQFCHPIARPFVQERAKPKYDAFQTKINPPLPAPQIPQQPPASKTALSTSCCSWTPTTCSCCTSTKCSFDRH